MREAAEFWDELLAQIEAGEIIPVVGPELLTVLVEGRETLFYQVLAQRLVAKYGLVASIGAPEDNAAADATTVSLRPYHELNDAVCAVVAQRGRRVQDLYRPINDLLKALVETPAESSVQLLRNLASVSGFKLFVTTTPDDLRNAINGCYLFLPLVSANTETREEGFFREEWTPRERAQPPHPGPQVHHPGRRGSGLRRQCRSFPTSAREFPRNPFWPRARR
jgi:hypothetical protein